MLLFIRPLHREVFELLQKEGIFQDPLDGLDQVGLQGRGMLLPRVQRVKELLQRLVAIV
jgi:hypothetical protein